MDKWSVDFPEPFSKSRKGNRYLIFGIESLSRFPYRQATPDQTTITALKYMNNLLALFASPKELACDKTGKNYEESEEHLPGILQGTRTQKSLATGFKPANLLLGINLRLPLENKKEISVKKEIMEKEIAYLKGNEENLKKKSESAKEVKNFKKRDKDSRSPLGCKVDFNNVEMPIEPQRTSAQEQNLFALFAGIYPRDNLRNAGFNFSSNQYNLVVQKANMDECRLMKYDRYAPEATARISDEIMTKKIKKKYDTAKSNENARLEQIIRLRRPLVISGENHKYQTAASVFWFKGGITATSPRIFSHDSLYATNYFMENHGKSDVDGHFGVLSRWFKEIERNMYLSSIEDLVSAFKEKLETSENISENNRVYHFQIYRKDAIRGLRIRAKVSSGFRNYLSLYLGDDVLMACPLSLPDTPKYFNIDFRIKVKRDIRTNKYAPDRSNPLESDTDIMGSTSRNTQRIRVEMLRGIGVSLSI
ncbi:hypothetical protein BB560_007281 [Smittium megazygosporum]|uniref:Integrase catalytic domain-containing protein n=1 Tax=Smittium megazygosporum TaxID=133381 RepID=A0A2T9XXD2_9FUNG|nr:hypothetical protein BB560_007281 [Smittium megazygosporum]